MKIVLGSRGSRLALWQARHVERHLLEIAPGAETEIHVIRTQGDKILGAPLAAIGGKGLFVKEIEEALLRNEIDVAIHSMKDMPTEIAPGLDMATVLEREDPRDALVSHAGLGLRALGQGACIGTSSLRRMCQLKAVRPDLRIEWLRGNVETRLGKVEKGQVDAAVLALAGLRRLEQEQRATEILSTEISLPAPGQGALAMQVRQGDARAHGWLEQLSNPNTHRAVLAERAFLARLEGGCQTPIAAHARCEGERLTLDGMVGRRDGRKVLRDRIEGDADSAAALGQALAEKLLAQGAGTILEEERRQPIP